MSIPITPKLVLWYTFLYDQIPIEVNGVKSITAKKGSNTPVDCLRLYWFVNNSVKRIIIFYTYCITLTICSFSFLQVCKDNWQLFQDSCYNVYPNFTTWPNALQVCRNNNAYLATITSEEENNFVTKIKDDASPITKLMVGWIGLRKSPPDYTTKWENGETFSFAKIETTDGFECFGTRSGNWATYGCTGQFPYICERPYH